MFLCQFETVLDMNAHRNPFFHRFSGRNGRVGKLNGSASKFEGEYVSLLSAQAFNLRHVNMQSGNKIRTVNLLLHCICCSQKHTW